MSKSQLMFDIHDQDKKLRNYTEPKMRSQ